MAHRIQVCSRPGCFRRTLDRYCPYCTRSFNVETLGGELKIPTAHAEPGRHKTIWELLPSGGEMASTTEIVHRAGLTKAAVARVLNALVKGQRASKEKRGREVFYGRS